ncbi:MAG TPA: site-specific integrase [Terriglobales bacterium]|nr:site-specific integrase [Terriglobales bacterium]
MTDSRRNQADQDGLNGPVVLTETVNAAEVLQGKGAQPPRAAGGPRRKPPKVRGIYEKVKGSGIWWCHYTDSGGRRRRERVGARSMAVSLLAKRQGERLQGKKLPETLNRRGVLFSELLDDATAYASEHHQLGGRKCDYRPALLKELLGARSAETITPKDIDRELSKVAREREWSPASYNRFKAFVSLAFRLGIENEKVVVNPARSVRRRREDNGRIRWLSAEEEARIVAAIQDRYPAELPAFLLALHTGMRRSEQYRLTWDCVDFVRSQLTIPKTKNGTIRYIPMDETATGALLALRDRGNGSGPVMVAAASGHGYTQGHALKTPREWFASACKLAAVPDFTWHGLRHSFASRLVMAGAALRTVQELMGHKTIAMTCRYAHLAPQHQLDAVRLLDGWGKAAVAGGLAGVQTATRTATGGIGAVGVGLPGQAQPVVQ